MRSAVSTHVCGVGIALALSLSSLLAATQEPATPDSARAVVDTYCIGCHSERLQTAGLVLEGLDPENIGTHAEVWEKVLRKVQAGAMPPATSRRPARAEYDLLIAALEGSLDSAAQANPNPGRPPIHRLNRVEYANAIRDLFGFEIDGAAMLPADDSGYGFDNIADVLTVTPGLLERYLLAATKISRLAIGDASMRPAITTYDVGNQTLGQEDRMSERLPFGTRGGTSVRHFFPLDGEYTVRFYLQRSDVAASNLVRGHNVTNLLDVRLDRRLVETFEIGSPEIQALGYFAEDYAPDSTAEARFFAKAGMHDVGVTLNMDTWNVEGVGVARLPLTSEAFNRGTNTSVASGKIDMTIQKVFIAGPFNGERPADSPVYRRLFVCYPDSEVEEESCARRILSTVARRAYRRSVTESDVSTLLDFYRQGREAGSFDAGIRTALERMLVDVSFLFRMETDPGDSAPEGGYRISDVDLASRLSFFLWSSIPDEELLGLAEQGRLREPAVLEAQVRRLLADERANALVSNFFDQWLYLRNIDSHTPDKNVFPDFDENLRQAFRQETALFLESQIRENRSVLELLTADYTFVNERLARHYEISGVMGSHFRRVSLSADSPRRGLLGQGGVLMVTSFADRTSVVVRGTYVLQNLLGIPPPPPPPNVPDLDETEVGGTLRQRMEQHRANPVCSTCHSLIDPPGFALESFDGIGKFRTMDGNSPINASGVLIDGTPFEGAASFRTALLTAQMDAFLTTLGEKLTTYALGRGVEYYDMPAIRGVLREAEADDYRWSTLILAIINSEPFQMRRAAS
jgi:mono/diheme cytochrome c family protein